MKPKILAVCGTRPDAIKMAPVVISLRKQQEIQTILAVSGQHKEMLEQALSAFDLTPDANFDIMRKDQSLTYITTSVLESVSTMLEDLRPDLVIAQGDTTTTFAAAVSAFYEHIPFAHVEAGLRTDTILQPFPEEFNRRVTSLITKFHFAPTKQAANNLRKENIPKENIFITGNTSIDALLSTIKRTPPLKPFAEGKMILVTTHRRENWGEPQVRICKAILKILREKDDVHFVIPMHRNEKVREVLRSYLENQERVFLIEPMDYQKFAQLMMASHIILTDSGGIQEEAPSLKKPILVLRDQTERPEGVAQGVAIIVGTDENLIYEECLSLLNDDSKYKKMTESVNPYGDGLASERITSIIMKHFNLPAEEVPEFNFTSSSDVLRT